MNMISILYGDLRRIDMKYIDVTSKDGRCIKVSDDIAFQEVTIFCDSIEQTNELVVKLITEFFKEE